MTDALLEPGTLVGVYRVEATLGEGGAGQVYRAVPAAGGEPVALKLMRASAVRDDESRRRFAREARAAAGVTHKHVVGVLEAGEVDGRPFLVMPYVPGRSLADRIAAEGPLPVAEAVRIVAQAGAGLDAAHRAGIVHRDVKASNVLLDESGDAALSDFGLAKAPGFSALTKMGQLMGTLDYIAPELLRGEPATPASDRYALGCVAHECLTGRTPFAGGGMFEVGMGHLESEPPDPAAEREDVSPALGVAVRTALAKDPAKRPPTATMYAHLLAAGNR